jgi:hypothetical protein
MCAPLCRSACHPAIIIGKDSRKAGRGARSQPKYRKQPHAKYRDAAESLKSCPGRGAAFFTLRR